MLTMVFHVRVAVMVSYRPQFQVEHLHLLMLGQIHKLAPVYLACVQQPSM